MPLAVRDPSPATTQADDIPRPVDIAAQQAEHVVAEAGVHDAKPVGDTGDAAEAIIAEHVADFLEKISYELNRVSRITGHPSVADSSLHASQL